MWSPHQHFNRWIILIINTLSLYSSRSRFLLPFIFIALAGFSLSLKAQLASLDYPKDHLNAAHHPDNIPSEESREIVLQQVVLDFEGLGNLDEILDFYNGGKSRDGFSGKNSGITFNKGAVSVSESIYGGSGKLNLDDMPSGVLGNLATNRIVMNIEAGFINSLSFRYLSADSGTVSIFNGHDGTDSLLAAKKFSSTNQRQWERFTLVFDDTARSVIITCKPGSCVFDEVSIGYDYYGKPRNPGFKSLFTTPVTFTKKGNISLSFLTRLGFITEKNEPGNGGSSLDGYESGYYNFDLLPKAGYFITDNFIVGLFADLELYNNKQKSEAVYGYKGKTLITGPFLRYYIPVSKLVIPFAEAQAGFGFDTYTSRSDLSSAWIKKKAGLISCRAGGGIAFFLDNGLGLDMFLGYQWDSNHFNDVNTIERSIDRKSEHNEFTMQLGLSLLIDR